MIEASGEEGDSDEEKETTEPPAECPAHKAAPTKTTKAPVMTDSEVYANAMIFLLAGNAATSMIFSYTSYLLAINPDIQEKLQSEIDAYFEEKPVSKSHKNSIYMYLADFMGLQVYTGKVDGGFTLYYYHCEILSGSIQNSYCSIYRSYSSVADCFDTVLL